MSDTNPITIQELVEWALPNPAQVIAGRDRTAKPVSWVVCVSAEDPAARVAPGDVVILLPPYPPDLADRLCELSERGAAGIALLAEPSAAAIETADRLNEPLIVLPESADVRQAERAALALLLDRGAATERRAALVYQELTVLSAEEAGLEEMAALISRTTAKSVFIQDKRLNVIAAALAPELESSRSSVESWIAGPANLPEELRDRKLAALGQIVLEQAMPIDRWVRLISPIVSKGMARGFISLVGESQALGPLDRTVAEKSAAACALEMAKAKAVSEAEKRVRGSFVDAMLAGTLSPLEAARWARRNKYDPEGRHAAIVVEWAKKEHPTYRRLETLVHGLTGSFHSGVLTQSLESEVVIFSRLEPRQGVESARSIAQSIRRQSSAEFPKDPMAIGIGRPVDALIGLRDSYRQARQALMMARRLADPNPLYFGELNVYRLLFQLERSPELATFCEEIIGKLVEYDRQQGTDLVETLSAYFGHNGNLSQTAEALFVHRNTLLYRMDRIREIGGLDLDNPETRLNIQLALRAHRLLTAREE